MTKHDMLTQFQEELAEIPDEAEVWFSIYGYGENENGRADVDEHVLVYWHDSPTTQTAKRLNSIELG